MTPVTPVEALDEVRARLEKMVGLCEGDRAYRDRIGVSWETDYNPSVADDEEDCYLAAANPDLLLRVAREALGVLDRHDVMGNGMCEACWVVELSWPCAEVKSVLRAWQP